MIGGLNRSDSNSGTGAEMAVRRRRAGYASGESSQVNPQAGEGSARERADLSEDYVHRTVAKSKNQARRTRASCASSFGRAQDPLDRSDRDPLLRLRPQREKVIQDLREAGLIVTFEWRSSKRTRDTNRHFLSPVGARLVATWRRCRVADLGAIPVDVDAAAKLMPHRAGVNRFFADLVRETLKRPGYGVETWRDEHKLRTPFGEVQPDSFGRLLHPGGAVEFYFEYDRDTEHIKPLIDKFVSYLRIASTWQSEESKRFPSVLFVVPKDNRELNLLRALLKAVEEWDPTRASSARLPLYCTTVARLAKSGSSEPSGATCSFAARDAFASMSCRRSTLPPTTSPTVSATGSPSPRKRMARRPSGKPAGRPAHEPIVLRAPELVPLDDEQREAVVRMLVELLDDWLHRTRRRKVAV